MKKIDFVKMGFRNLWRRKLRTILTITGVVIGTFSIVIMVSLGVGMTEGYKEQLAQWGSLTKITIDRYNYVWDEDTGVGSSNEKKLDEALVNKLKTFDHVRGVTPIMQVDATLKSGKYQAYASITGIDPAMLEYFDFPKVQSGDYISSSNPEAVLFGSSSVYFYNPKGNGGRRDTPNIDLMNDKIKITFDNTWESDKVPKYEKLKVAGVLAESQDETSYSIYAPFEQVREWYIKKQKSNGKKVSAKDISYSSIWVSVDDVDNVAEIQQKIKDMGYGSYSMADSLDNVKQTSNMLQLILGGIGAVSLLVSAIGIANTMVMSIYERTKEIGVMKVLGCLVTDIRKIFLFEAMIIGFCGGVAGIGLSYLVSHILNKYAPQLGSILGFDSASTISVIPVWLAVAAVGFAMIIGVVSGLYPAIRATKIKALDAIRNE